MTEVDSIVERVASQVKTWSALDFAQRAAILKSCSDGVFQVAEAWARSACDAKGIDWQAPASGEEWFTGPALTLRHLRQYRETLLRGAAFPKSRLRPQVPGADLSSAGWAARVFPFETWDLALFPGVTAEVRGAPGSKPTCGTLGPGGCCAVLGAGNINSIPPLDILYQLLKEDRVVVVKLNPVNEYLRPIL